jgi:hypothetical protein
MALVTIVVESGRDRWDVFLGSRNTTESIDALIERAVASVTRAMEECKGDDV